MSQRHTSATGARTVVRARSVSAGIFPDPSLTLPTRQLHGPRAGYTLIELLVVVFLIILFAGLAAYFMPGFDQRERANQGATSLQGWLQIARQSALRDQAPRGVRLFPAGPKSQLYNRGQYLELPDDFTGGWVISAPDAPNDPNTGKPDLRYLKYSAMDPTGGFPGNQDQWQVQPLDKIQLNGSGLVHQINAIDLNNQWLILASPVPFQITTGPPPNPPNPMVPPPPPNYRIIRQPRLVGDGPMDLASDVAIDFSINPTFGMMPQLYTDINGNYLPIDIMFAPNGSVMNAAGVDKLVFWVRESTYQNYFDGNYRPPFVGNPTLIALYPTSGMVNNYDVAVDNQANPFANVP